MNALAETIHRFFGRLLILLVSVVLCAAPALADGVMMPTEAVKAIPDIPLQRAVLVYKDGLETLVIENTVNSESDLGWIVPIPASPEEIDVSTPGLLPTLSMSVGPEIRSGKGGKAMIGVQPLLMLLVLIWVLYVLAGPAKDRWSLVTSMFVILVVVGTPMAIALPNAMTSGSETRAGVVVETNGKFGSYEVSVLDATSPDALNVWLTGNGFIALPTKGEVLVKDYIDEGWKFLAARLVQTESGTARPHPLKVSFPVEKPVYPMRLTALTGSDVYLELTTISESGLETPGLKTEFRQRFKAIDKWSDPNDVTELITSRFHSEQTGVHLAHPELDSLMWTGCVVSGMTGPLTPAEMREDFFLDAVEFSPLRRVYYSKAGAMTLATDVLAWSWCAGVPLCFLILWPLIQRQIARFFGLLKVLASTVLLVLLPVLIVYSFVPKIETTRLGREGWDRHNVRHFRYLSSDAQREGGAEWDNPDYWRKRIETEHRGRIIEEDSPGHYTFVETEEALVIRVWLKGGAWVDFPLKPEPE